MAFNVIFGILMQLIWLRLADLSFLTIITLLTLAPSVSPSIPAVIQQVILKLIFFDILFPEFWMPKMLENLGIDGEDDGEPLPTGFVESGYESRQFIKNCGSLVFYLGIYILFLFAHLILTFLARFCPSLKPS
jgi:hypothetical protein